MQYLPQLIGIGLVLVLMLTSFIIAVKLRTVVTTNTVHIVQSRSKTIPYGTGQNTKNVYYKWPSWLPILGVQVIELPISNFQLSLKSYEAYDKDRVPFDVDVVAFFRIKDTAKAAQRISNISELQSQLTQIVQGAVRKVLASDVIDSIMVERAKFGTQFTDEVKEQLEEWGVESVKSMELMDIRDGQGGKVISNIMAKKVSHIEMLSRTEVANNHQLAETAEIAAAQTVAIRKQDADEQVGKRTAEKEMAVGIAQQQSQQSVMVEQATTQEKAMAVNRVAAVKTAEIERDKQLVLADQTKKTTILVAEGQKQTAILNAEGTLEAKKREAEATTLTGNARGAAEKAFLLAAVDTQIALAKEIGGNEGYQQYLISLEAIKAQMTIGVEQAQALQKADVKVISNTGSTTEGVSRVMDMFTSGGGSKLAGMLESLAQSNVGAGFLKKLGLKFEKAEKAEPAEKA